MTSWIDQQRAAIGRDVCFACATGDTTPPTSATIHLDKDGNPQMIREDERKTLTEL